MKILVNFVSVFLLFIQLTVVNLTAGQNTSDRLLDMDDSLDVKKDVIFQDRLVERLSCLVQAIEQNISTMLSEMQNPPFVQLLKGICPKMLMQEPDDGLKFRCHAFGMNECLCFSHKKATWYKAEAFCRQFRMTLADLSTDNVEWIKDKVNNPSAVDEKGEWYWTSATDRFVRGQMIWTNTGQLYKNSDYSSDLSEFESCLKFSSTGELLSQSCFEENHFLCQKFLDFFPLKIRRLSQANEH